MSAETESPVSRPFRASGLPAAGRTVTIEADANQRAALARDHGLGSVEAFQAEILAKPFKRGGVRVTGRVTAAISQACVVTLDPIETAIDEEVSVLFVPEGSPLANDDFDGGEFVLEAEGPDAPEPFSGDTIDLGAVAEEFFELAIDPFPRKPGAEIGKESTDGTGDNEGGPMYEGLKKLRSGN